MLEVTNLDSFGWDTALEGGSLLNKTEKSGSTTIGVAVDMQFVSSPKVKTEHQRYIEQKSEEIALVSFLRFQPYYFF